MTLTRGFIRNAETTPLDALLMDMAKIVANADGSPRPGVLGGANASIVSATGTMHVAIAAAEFATSKGRAYGVTIFTNDGAVNVEIDPAPASNSRIDTIYVKHNDDTTGDADALPVFGVAKGTAAASPVKAAIPTGALELATLRIYAGTTATNGGANTLTNTYAMTAARGGAVPFRTRSDIKLWTNAIDGQLAVNLADGVTYRHRASGWVGETPLRGIATGGGSVAANDYAPSWATINFPAGRFDAEPVVLLTPIESDSIQRLVASVRSVTTTSAIITVRNVSGAAASAPRVQWVAFEV